MTKCHNRKQLRGGKALLQELEEVMGKAAYWLTQVDAGLTAKTLAQGMIPPTVNWTFDVN